MRMIKKVGPPIKAVSIPTGMSEELPRKLTLRDKVSARTKKPEPIHQEPARPQR